MQNVSRCNSCVFIFVTKSCVNLKLFRYFSALPVFIVIPQNETLQHGKSVFFQCEASGASKQVKWFKDGQPLEGTNTEEGILVTEQGLVILKLAYSHAGKFTCQASNDAGIVTADAHLKVVSNKIKGEMVWREFA